MTEDKKNQVLQYINKNSYSKLQLHFLFRDKTINNKKKL